MVAKYYHDSDRGLYDPSQTSEEFFKESSTGTALVENINALNSAKTQGIHLTGETKLKSVTHVKTDLAKDPKSSPPTIPYVQFMVCYDVSSVNVVDKDGKSVVPASRKPTGLRLLGVVNYEYPNPDGWRVGYVQPKRDKC